MQYDINLLPWRESNYKKRIRQTYIILILSFLSIIASTSIYQLHFYKYFLKQKNILVEMISKKEKIENDYQKALHMHEFFMKKSDYFYNIEKENEANKIFLMSLNKMTTDMPNALYLTEIKKENNLICFKGISFSQNEIALFLQHIQSSFHQTPKLDHIDSIPNDDKKTYFSICL